MNKREIITRIGIALLFFISLYFVEAGFCGSSVVAKYNNGFGTLDMKKYNVLSVQNVLSTMGQEGIAVYKLYYLMDYIFILFFGLFQIMLIHDVYSFNENRMVKAFIIGIPILRGLCDMIENTILLRTLFTFPKVNEIAISISSFFTQMKLWCIKGWGLLLFIGLAWRMVLHFKK
mgnify:FL=1